jgi:hypothetical protein
MNPEEAAAILPPLSVNIRCGLSVISIKRPPHTKQNSLGK